MAYRVPEKSFYFRNIIDDYEEEDEEMGGDFEDGEVNDFGRVEKSEDLACPFCSEDFDVLGFCCHIDADHRMEVKSGICPFCTTKYSVRSFVNLNLKYALCIKKLRNARSRSTLFQLRKDMQEKHLCSIKESPSVESVANSKADSMLMSFVNNSRLANNLQTKKSASSIEASLSVESSIDDSVDRTQPTSSTDWKIKRASRLEFLQELVLCTILDDL